MKNETSQIGCGQRLAGIMRLAAEESDIRFVSQSLVLAAICCMLTAPAGAASIETVRQVQHAIDENRTKLVLPDGMELRGITTETNVASRSAGDVVVRAAGNQQQAELRLRFFASPSKAQEWIADPISLAIDTPAGEFKLLRLGEPTLAKVAALLGHDPARLMLASNQTTGRTTCYLLRSNDDPFVVIASAGDLRLAIILAVGQERLLERVMPALTIGRSSEAGDHEYFPFRPPDSMSYRLGMVVSLVPAAQVDSLRNSCTCSGTEARGEAGLRVLSLDPGGAAGEAGLKPGDVIVAVNGRNVATRQEFDRMGESQKPGATVRFEALRRQEIDGLDWMEVRIITPKVP